MTLATDRVGLVGLLPRGVAAQLVGRGGAHIRVLEDRHSVDMQLRSPAMGRDRTVVWVTGRLERVCSALSGLMARGYVEGLLLPRCALSLAVCEFPADRWNLLYGVRVVVDPEEFPDIPGLGDAILVRILGARSQRFCVIDELAPLAVDLCAARQGWRGERARSRDRSRKRAREEEEDGEAEMRRETSGGEHEREAEAEGGGRGVKRRRREEAKQTEALTPPASVPISDDDGGWRAWDDRQQYPPTSF